MATGVVLSRKWQPPVPPLTFTAWQLTAGGLLLVPVTLWMAPEWPRFTVANLMGLVWMGAIGGAFTYLLWFRGLARIEPTRIAVLGFLSPLTAVLIGVLLMNESLTPLQLSGGFLVLSSVWIGQLGQKQSLAVKAPKQSCTSGA